MNTAFKRCFIVLMIASLGMFPKAGGYGSAQAKDFDPPAQESSLTSNGVIQVNNKSPVIYVVDPDPAMQGIQAPVEPEVQAAIDAQVANPDAISSTFSITYQAAGYVEPLGNAVCQTFPADVKTAFNAAAAIWAATIQSSVPITISACWSNLGSSNILGYSGYQYIYRDFSGAPKANTWYSPALANALSGSDLDASDFDDYTTLNSGFSWYTGTDGIVPAGKYDLMTVVAHEITHSLNFSGSAYYASGNGSYGYGTVYPDIYDTFMENISGTKLTSYTNPSPALGSLLTSGSLWFNGTNANAANSNGRVKIYAPSPWLDGASYSHLDYSTFAGGANSLMVYAIGSGSSQHNPGPVTKGMLKDMGWTLATTAPAATTGAAGSITSSGATLNGTVNANNASTTVTFQYGLTASYGSTVTAAQSPVGGTGNTPVSASVTGLSANTLYHFRVAAANAGGTTYGSDGTFNTLPSSSFGPILLVDDDNNNPDVRSYYSAALSALGATFDVWNTNNSDNEPTVSTLANYDTVIWFTGAAYGGYAGPGAAGETALGNWLSGGGCFLLSSQDYLYDRGITTFGNTYLGIGGGTNDVGQTTVTGTGGVFSGLGPYTLNYPFSNFSDIVLSDGTAEDAFSGDKGNAALDKNGGTYRTAFFGFPFEAIAAAADRQQVMNTFLNSCNPTNPTVTVVDVFTTDNVDAASQGIGDQAISANTASASLKTNFHPGDPIRLWIQVNNQYSTAQTAHFDWIVLNPVGSHVPELEYSSDPDLQTNPGIWYWYLENSIPVTAMSGAYTFTGHINFNGHESSKSTTFYVSSLSATVYLPLIARAPAAPTFFEGPWEQEPNNSSSQANGPLRSNKDYYGYPNDQKDYFSINTGSNGQIVIDLTNVTGGGVQLQLFYQVADVEHRVAFARNAPYHLSYTGDPGTYYIYIYTESNYNSSNAYTLRVTYP